MEWFLAPPSLHVVHTYCVPTATLSALVAATVCTELESHHATCSDVYETLSIVSRRPAGFVLTVSEYCFLKFAVYVALVIIVTLCTAAPPSLNVVQTYCTPVPLDCAAADTPSLCVDAECQVNDWADVYAEPSAESVLPEGFDCKVTWNVRLNVALIVWFDVTLLNVYPAV